MMGNKKINVSTEDVRKYFRFENKLSDLMEQIEDYDQLQFEETEIVPDDVKVCLDYALSNEMEPNELFTWGMIFGDLMYDFIYPIDEAEEGYAAVYCYGTWAAELDYVLCEMNGIANILEWAEFNEVKAWLEEVQRDFEQWQPGRETDVREELSESRLTQLMYLYNKDAEAGKTADDMNDEEIAVYKKVLEIMVERENPDAIRLMAYDYYGGNKAYPCDWEKARDMMLKLMELDPEQNGRWANTLGYIYYYGRCNGGKPEYEKAFQYFSLGAAYGMFESTYKLADMYLAGKGVPKDEVAAYHLVERFYSENFERFINGSDQQVLADVALRMASMTFNGQGTERDVESAFAYYLIADHDICRRMEKSNFFGNQKVYNGIQAGIAECLAQLNPIVDAKKIKRSYPIGIAQAFRGDYVLKIKVKETDKGLKFTTKRVEKFSGECAFIPMIVPNYSYCNFLRKTKDYAVEVREFWTKAGGTEFHADNMEVDAGEDCTVKFYLFGEEVARVRCDQFEFELR